MATVATTSMTATIPAGVAPSCGIHGMAPMGRVARVAPGIAPKIIR